MTDLQNLHKFYYKDYFSGIDFSFIFKKEMIEEKKKKRKELDSSNDPVMRNVIIPNLGKEIKTIEDDIKNITNKNAQAISDRNSVLIAKNYSEELLKKCNPPRIELENDKQTKTTIELEIQYPGLVTGIGIDHEATIEGEFKLGVHFDWTHGMPVIYGSSVKGVLRTWFREFYKGNRDPYDYEMEIFEGKLRDTEKEKEEYGTNWEMKVKSLEKRIYTPQSIYKRDIFFDAVITKGDSNGRILCSDSITPHGGTPLKNPTPITFMKIAPGCQLQFRFKLNGNEDEKNSKLNLFETILTTVGVGAKTNVGYGQLKQLNNAATNQ